MPTTIESDNYGTIKLSCVMTDIDGTNLVEETIVERDGEEIGRVSGESHPFYKYNKDNIDAMLEEARLV